MKISEVIKKLEELKEKHGDLIVVGAECIWSEELREGDIYYSSSGNFIYI